MRFFYWLFNDAHVLVLSFVLFLLSSIWAFIMFASVMLVVEGQWALPVAFWLFIALVLLNDGDDE